MSREEAKCTWRGNTAAGEDFRPRTFAVNRWFSSNHFGKWWRHAWWVEPFVVSLVLPPISRLMRKGMGNGQGLQSDVCIMVVGCSSRSFSCASVDYLSGEERFKRVEVPVHRQLVLLSIRGRRGRAGAITGGCTGWGNFTRGTSEYCRTTAIILILPLAPHHLCSSDLTPTVLPLLLLHTHSSSRYHFGLHVFLLLTHLFPWVVPSVVPTSLWQWLPFIDIAAFLSPLISCKYSIFTVL